MPRILDKHEETIITEILARGPFYTPEWETADKEDAGIAVAQIMARFGDTAISRLNIAPKLHFLSFLEMIQVRLLRAQPSRVPLTFCVSDDAPGPVSVPGKTRASSEVADGQPVVFETEEHLIATPAQLDDLVSVNPRTDEIFHHISANEHNTAITLFLGKNSQEHSLYIGDSATLSVANAIVTITIKGTKVSALAHLGVEWSYSGEIIIKTDGKEEKIFEPQIVAISNIHTSDTTLSFDLAIDCRIAETEIRGIKNRWLRCTAKSAISRLTGITIDSIIIESRPAAKDEILPDQLFCDDVPADPKSIQQEPVYPFGHALFLYKCFYIASAEAFTKRKYSVQITVDSTVKGSSSPPCTLAISWEYWDGAGWMHLNTSPTDLDFTQKFIVTISALPEIRQTRVNGKENYWIRMRLIGGQFDTVPFFTHITIRYCPPSCGTIPEHIITTDNQDIVLRENAPFPIFAQIPDPFPSLYLGFNKPLVATPLNIFFAVDPMQEYPAEFHPDIIWQYLGADGEWQHINAQDETHGVTRPGIVKIEAPGLMAGFRLFGSSNPLYWLRAQFTESFFDIPTNYQNIQLPWLSVTVLPWNSLFGARFWIQYAGTILSMFGQENQFNLGNIPVCPAPIEVLNPSLFPSAVKKALPPLIRGVFPNTTWAPQCRTVPEDFLGSGTGEAGRSFTLVNVPVVSADVWVNEAGSLTPSDLDMLRIPGHFRETMDKRDNTAEFWVRWNEVENLALSKKSDRQFELDPSSGTITFGDRHHGRIPPIGLNNLRVVYRTGGGKRGNLASNMITSLQQDIAFINEVSNPLAAEGGCDCETVEALIRRAPRVLRHRGRAITTADFESLAHDASREVAKVRVLENFDTEGNYKPGRVTVVIVPHSQEPKPLPSPELKRRVEQYLKKNSSNVLQIAVIQPSYLQVNITASLFTRELDLVPLITGEANKTLTDFLHPLTGGDERGGWPFGGIPCVSDIYTVLESIDGVNYVNNVTLSLDPGTSASPFHVRDNMMAVKIPPYCLPFCGNLSLKTTWMPVGGR
ncbi:MAG: hypothetical protein APR53_02865 [Methanoculleus sp. SDB]|nr:MAG: hypothetical protein APR53_02865 [Methanoculleus sp. SDB]